MQVQIKRWEDGVSDDASALGYKWEDPGPQLYGPLALLLRDNPGRWLLMSNSNHVLSFVAAAGLLHEQCCEEEWPLEWCTRENPNGSYRTYVRYRVEGQHESA